MTFDISIPREEFDNALQKIRKAHRGKYAFDLYLGWEDGGLRMVTRNASLKVPATGIADVRIVLPGRRIIGFECTFPNLDLLHFCLTGTVLRIERLTMSCEVIE